jgi:hypothetical protein
MIFFESILRSLFDGFWVSFLEESLSIRCKVVIPSAIGLVFVVIEDGFRGALENTGDTPTALLAEPPPAPLLGELVIGIAVLETNPK